MKKYKISGKISNFEAVAVDEVDGILRLQMNVGEYKVSVLPTFNRIDTSIIPNIVADGHAVDIELEVFKKFNCYYCYDSEFFKQTKHLDYEYARGDFDEVEHD